MIIKKMCDIFAIANDLCKRGGVDKSLVIKIKRIHRRFGKHCLKPVGISIFYQTMGEGTKVLIQRTDLNKEFVFDFGGPKEIMHICKTFYSMNSKLGKDEGDEWIQDTIASTLDISTGLVNKAIHAKSVKEFDVKRNRNINRDLIDDLNIELNKNKKKRTDDSPETRDNIC
jgi:hypothetical protein